MSAKILIVEDEMLVALSLRITLEELGHECVGIAPDLDTAMRLASECPDLALVDLNLRDGLTGPQIGETLCNEHDVAVLFVTANPRVLGDGIAGTIGVLTKPTEREAIEAAVNYAIRLRNGNAATPPAVLKTFARSA
jgi:two-component system, response regulator PdtaR